MAWVCDSCGAIHDAEPKTVRFGDLTFNEATNLLTCGPISVRLTPREAHVMADFMTGRQVTKEALMMRHFDQGTETEHGMSVYAHRLRRKMKAVGSAAELRTIWGAGYQLVSAGDRLNTVEAIQFGDVTLNVRQRSLTCGKNSAPLRPQTTYILEDLMRNFSAPERQLVERYIGKSGDRIKNLRVQMTYIRRALAEIGSGIEIVNTRGEGYWIRMRPDHRVPRAGPAGARYAPGAAAPAGPPSSAAT